MANKFYIQRVGDNFLMNKRGNNFYVSQIGPQHTLLDYIESTGVQYINLGIIPNNTMGVKVKFYVDSATGKNYVIGSRGAGVGRFYLYSTENSPTDVKYGWGNLWATTGIPPVVGTPIEASLNYLNDRKYIYNGTEVNSNLQNQDFSGNTYNMYLFSANFANVFYNDAILKGRIYCCEITEGDKVIMHLIPVLDKDLVPCMYDKVSGQYFYNQGDGEFKWKLPNQLEYLESTGAQYIETGFLSNQLYDKSLYVKMKTTGGTSSYAYNGAYHTSGTGLTIQFGLLATSNTLCRTTLNHFDPSYLNVTDLQKSEFTEMMMTPTEYWVNGEFKANHQQTSVDKILETNNKFLIFGRSQYNNVDSITPMIISEFWIKDANGKFIQHLIPVLNRNFVACMYDLVSKKYFKNQGIGQFTYNLFDPTKPSYVAGYISTNNNGTISASTLTDTFYIRCLPNTTYKIERTSYAQADQVWRAASSSVEPYVGMKISNMVGGLINDLSLTITTGPTDKYLLFSEGYTTNINDLNKFRITIMEK